MILVQGIGMSGYVPFDGLVSLSHFSLDLISSSRLRLDYYSHKRQCKFYYLPRVKSESDLLSVDRSREITDTGILPKVISFAVVRCFKDSIRLTIIRDVGLLSGYYCAGAVFPRKLFSVFDDTMYLKSYRNWTTVPVHPGYIWGGTSFCSAFGSNTHFCTTAWDEYICLERKKSYIFGSRILIRNLRHKSKRRFYFPGYAFASLSFVELLQYAIVAVLLAPFVLYFALYLIPFFAFGLLILVLFALSEAGNFVVKFCKSVPRFCFGFLNRMLGKFLSAF